MKVSGVVEQAATDLMSNAGPGQGDFSLEGFLDKAVEAPEEAPAPQEGENDESESESDDEADPELESDEADAEDSEDAADEDSEEDSDEVEDDEDESDEEEDEEEVSDAKLGKRAAQRIRKLAKEKAEAAAKSSQLEGKVNQVIAVMQEREGKLVNYIQGLQQQMVALQQRVAEPPKDPAKMSHFELLEAELNKKMGPQFQSLVESKVKEAVGPLAEAYEALKQERAAEKQASEEQRYKNSQLAQMDVAIKRIYKGRQLSKSERGAAEVLLLGLANARQTDVKDVVLEAKKYIEDLLSGEVAGRRQKGKSLKEKHRGVPKAGRSATKSRGDGGFMKLTKDQLNAAGYSSPLQAMQDGYRNVTPKIIGKSAGARRA